MVLINLNGILKRVLCFVENKYVILEFELVHVAFAQHLTYVHTVVNYLHL